jgi:hypothetical protein
MQRSTCYFPLANALRGAEECGGAKQNGRERERELRAAAVCTLGFPRFRVPTEGDDRSSSHVPYVDEARRFTNTKVNYICQKATIARRLSATYQRGSTIYVTRVNDICQKATIARRLPSICQRGSTICVTRSNGYM